jgi:hypothetical protein
VWSILDSFCNLCLNQGPQESHECLLGVFFLVEEIKHLSLPSCSHVLIAATSSASHGIFSSTSHGNFAVRERALLMCVFCFRFRFPSPEVSLWPGVHLCRPAKLQIFRCSRRIQSQSLINRALELGRLHVYSIDPELLCCSCLSSILVLLGRSGSAPLGQVSISSRLEWIPVLWFRWRFERISRFWEWQQRLEWCGFSAGEWESNPLLLLL